MNTSWLNRKYQDYLFIIILALLAYWPVSFMLFSVKNDAINYFLAMRYNTSEAIQSGHFPLWSPYINLGYPLHGDMQSGTWNPVVLVMSLIRKYDIYWLQLETILTVIIAGFSFYKLLNHFNLKRVILLTGSAAYMLNGYITDSGQFLNWLYAAAYLPLVMLYAIRSFEKFSARDAFLLGLSFSLMLLSAYPADFILLGYLLLAYFILSVIRYSNESGWTKSLIRCLKPTLIAGLSFFLICLPAILSYLPFLASIRRGNGVDLDVALSNSQSPVNFLSVLTPWPTLRLDWEQYTDPLIRNCYIGLIPLVFLIAFTRLRGKKTFLQYFLSGTLIFFLLFSLGKAGGLRVLTYYTLPLLDSFRHPANAKLFFLFAAQLLAFLAIDKYLKDPLPYQSAVFRTTNILLIITGLLLITGLVKSRLLLLTTAIVKGSDRTALKNFYDSIRFSDFLFLNAALAFTTLLVLRWVLKKHKLQRFLLPVLCAEMILIAQFMIPLTYFRTYSPQSVQQLLNAQPAGYPIPDSQASLQELSADGMRYFNEIGCLNPFNKKPGRSDYIITPANLSWQLDFWEDTVFREKILQYPFFYIADTVYAIQDKNSFLSDSTTGKFALADLGSTVPQTPRAQQTAKASITSFGPAKIQFAVRAASPSFLVLLQNHYPNWEVRINGQKAEIRPANHAFMGVLIPAGDQVVEFRYKATFILYLAIGSLLFTIAGLVYFSRRKKIPVNRKLTNTIRFIMDEGIPAFIRDSRWFMYPFFWYWFKGKNLSTYMDFKKIAWGLTEEEFNRIYQDLDCRATDRPTDLNDKSIQRMLDNLHPEAKTLLDVGCGRGHWLNLVGKARKELQLTGCDVFEEETVKKDFTFRKGSIYRLPFEDRAFDIVTCHHTIEHLPDLEKAISELKRVTRKQLIIVTPRQRYYYYTLDLHLHFFPEKEYLQQVTGTTSADCVECDGDWCLIANT